uniref:hypothetical protein n=1 Tax=Goniotrichopsis reniformis TaxID=468933 RepID=UPI001FCCF329|nr:hypothetical protein MW428_pgp094 [Goniotrichopsis reniformis]UNJ14804.1 hypothetical protein [Goniotrichopsis reniformis]
MVEIIQFYRIRRNITSEIRHRIGEKGIIVGNKRLDYFKEGYLIEFYDNIRFWLLAEEIRKVFK